MEYSEWDQDIDEISNAIAANSCVAFIGSGLSVSAIRSNGKSLPTWEKLLEEIIQKKIEDEKVREDLINMLDDNDLLLVAQAISKKVDKLHDYLVSIFDDAALEPAYNHELLTEIGFRAITTTNYDRLIEKAYKEARPIYTQNDIDQHAELLKTDNRDFYIFKMHGDIKDPKSIVIDFSDYEKLRYNNSGYRKFVQSLFLSNTVLFLGFGNNDPEIKQFMEEIKYLFNNQDNKQHHFILMDKNKISDTKTKLWLECFGLKTIVYENSDRSYAQITEFLKELKTSAENKRNIGTRSHTAPNMDAGNIKAALFEGSKHYYERLRGSSGRFHHINISDLLLPHLNERFFDTFIKSNGDTKKIQLKASIEKLWPAENVHTIIVGEGGMGKTISVIRLWEEYLGNRNAESPVPVFLALNEYNNNHTEDKEYILQQMGRNYLGIANLNENDKNQLWKLLSEKRSDGRPSVILFFDGFNEITAERRNLIIELNDMIENAAAAQIIITSRFDMRSVQNWGTFNKLELADLSDRAISNYLGKEKFADISGKPIYQILKNPMMLTIYNKACTEVVFDNSLYRFKSNIEKSGELLWNYFEGLRKMQHEKNSADTRAKALYDFVLKYLIPYIGYKMESAGLFVFTQNEIEKVINNAFERFGLPDFLRTEKLICENDEFLDLGHLDENRQLKRFYRYKDILCNELRVLVEEDSAYRFLHQNFRDFFSAAHILNEINITLFNSRPIKFPSEMKNGVISYYVGKYIGEIEGEHYYVPRVNYEKKCWDFDGDTETSLRKFLNQCRGIFDKSVGLTVFNIIEIWKNARGELTGEDLKNLDLTNVLINSVQFSRSNRNKMIAAEFEGSILKERNILPLGHSHSVNSAIYSEDGKRIISASDDGSIKEWDRETGECIRTFEGHTSRVTSAIYNADEKRILSASDDGSIKEWDRETGECIRTFEGHSESVKSAIYSTDGKRILSASYDGGIKEWDRETGECIRTFKDHSFEVASAIYSADGKRILSASYDGGIKEWDRETGECIRTFKDHSFEVASAIYSADEKKILSVCFDHSIKEWDRETGECIRTFGGHSEFVTSAIYSADGKRILSASFDNSIKEWDQETGECIHTFEGHSFIVRSAIYSPDGKKILSASLDHSIKEWDRETGECIRTFGGHSNSVYSAIYSADGKRILSSSWNHSIREWDRETGECIQTFEGHSKMVNSAIYSADGKKILSASEDGSIKEWDRETGECIRTFVGHSFEVASAIYSADGKKILSASEDGSIKEWNRETGECIQTFEGHSKRVNSAIYSADGKRILSASFDCLIKEWDRETGECIRTFGGHSNKLVTSAIYSADGKRILAAVFRIKEWDRETGKCIRTFGCHSIAVNSAIYSADGKRILSAFEDGSIKEWDRETGECIHTFEGHSEFVTSAIYSADGKRILSASHDGSIKEWDRETGECIRIFENIFGLLFSGCSFKNLHHDSNLSEKCREIMKIYGARF